MYAPVKTAAPASAPVTLVQAKAHLRVDHDDEDDKITAFVAAATEYLDGWTGILGRAIVEQTWRQDFDGFARCLRLPLAPVSAISSVTYLDANGDSQTVSSGDYQLLADARGAFVRFDSDFAYPAVQSDGPNVHVTFVAGYSDDEADIPAPLKSAILLLAAHYYENREAAATPLEELPLGVKALLAPYRRVGV